MKNKRLRGILYLCAVLVLFALGMLVWMKTSGIVEEKTFTADGMQEVTFEYNAKIEIPKAVRVRLEGTLDCDALLIIKENGQGDAVRFRRSFPLKAGKLEDYDLQAGWTSPGMIVELRTNGCLIHNIKIHLSVEG